MVTKSKKGSKAKKGKKGEGKPAPTNNKVVCTNRKAFHDYNILETFETGIVLKGSEVKSLRAGKANLLNTYALIKDGEVLLLNLHITPLDEADKFSTLPPDRTRKLLLHKREIEKLIGKTKEKGFNLIPTKVYFTRGKAKIALSLAQPKKLFDKREALKEKAVQRDDDRLRKSN